MRIYPNDEQKAKIDSDVYPGDNLLVRSGLEPACHENDGKKHYRLKYETSVHWMLP